MVTYTDFTNQSRSEKVVLCHIEPVERFLIWTLDSGAIYKRTVSNFVIDIKEGTTSLTEASSAVLSSGEWFYDSLINEVYIRTSDDSNPNTKNVVGTYRLFYSNSPVILPYDLASGAVVEYQGRLKSNSAISKELDDEQIGISIESSTNIVLYNDDGHFDDTYDTLFFENKTVKIYSWSPTIALSEKQLLFSGEIQDKSFSTKTVKFSCKDFMYKLREKMSLPLFSTSDGNVSSSIIGTPKRRIYGQVSNVRLVPINNILDGFTLTGNLSGALGSATITGIGGTLFLDEVSPNDKLTITLAREVVEITVSSVESDTSLTITDELELGFSLEAAVNLPERPWRKKNRNWSITGHKLREPTTTVNVGSQPNRFSVVDGSDMFDGDLIDVNGTDITIKRIIGNDIVLRQNLSGTPNSGDSVTKNPVSEVYIEAKESFINRDWTLTNTTEAILNFNNLAEFNVASQKLVTGSFTFTNGSRTVTVGTINPLNQVQSRDWIASDDVTHTTFYEILSVSDTDITLRVAYAGANNAGNAYKKNIDLIHDESLITVNCIGLENSGVWAKSASDAVNHLLTNDSTITNINTASFTEADADAPYILSMVIPEEIGGDIPIIRDVISKINSSVLASLVNNSDFDLVYNILTTEKPTDLTTLSQHDIIGEPKIKSRNEIIRKVNLKYAPFTDRFKNEDSFRLIEYTNAFVDDYIGARQEMDITAYLFSSTDAQAIAERYGLYNSLSQSNVTVKGKLNLTTKNLNDKIFITLDRIYKRFGGRDRKKIGIINKIVKDGANTTVEFNDLGNIFNRVMSIAPDTANDFTSATETEKIINCYICDNDLEVPNITSDQELGTQIIG